MSNPKLIVQLSGGLGNQMFQYACARSLVIRHAAELVLDDWSGFVRDSQYRRRYELAALPIRARVTKPWERWPIWLHRWHHRRGQPSPAFVEKHWYGRFIYETETVWLPKLLDVPLKRSTWITGYWQSPRYFIEHAAELRAELMPPPARQAHFVAIARKIQETDSVALGLRLYEESKDPTAHARDGRLKGIEQIRLAIAQIRERRPTAQFFVFCTHRSSLLNALNLPLDSIYLTHDEGYVGTIERLWLLSHCRHHLFTNSSYYWWGAWLSAALRGREGQEILAADNFLNRDGLCPEWKTF